MSLPYWHFAHNFRVLKRALGYKIFDSIAESTVKHQDGQMYFYIHGARGANAKGVLVADGFAVMKDSVIANTTVPSMSSSLVQLRNTLLEKGIIDESCHLTKDHIFTSPSLAAAIVMGRNANGRTE